MPTQRERIVLPLSVSEWRSEMLQARIREFALDGRIAILAARLENIHRDPADRFIAATSLQHHATLITADQSVVAWESELPRQDARL